MSAEQQEPFDSISELEWDYGFYRATLKRGGKFFALVTPDGKSALKDGDALDLINRLNAYDELAEQARVAKSMAGDAIMQRDNLHNHLQQLETTWLRKAKDDRNDIQTLRDALQPFSLAAENLRDAGAINPNETVALFVGFPDDGHGLSIKQFQYAKEAYEGTEPR